MTNMTSVLANQMTTTSKTKQYLAFDIGGTNLKYGLLDRSGNLLEKGSVSTVKSDLGSFLRQLTDIASAYQGRFRGIAICSPGKVDIKQKVIHYGGTLPFLDGANMQTLLGDQFQVPVGVENDAKAATLAEMWLGQLQTVSSGVMITLGSEVGGGIMINHHLLHGANFQAGEISFIPYDHHAEDWGSFTGQTCSAVNLIRQVNQVLGTVDVHDGLAAFAAINAHDNRIWPLFQAFCDRVAYTIVTLQAILDMQRVVIAGGISAQPIVLTTINEAYDRLAQACGRLGREFTKPEIVPAHFKNDANLYGALYALLIDQEVKQSDHDWSNL